MQAWRVKSAFLDAFTKKVTIEQIPRKPLKKYLSQEHLAFYQWLLRLRSIFSMVSRPYWIGKYLASTEDRKLQLGAGRNYLEGWLNTDYWAKHPRFIYVDVSRRFPFSDETFTRIFSEHMIEHVPLPAAVNMLAESFRVLRSGGRIRIETPDLEKICGLYAAGENPAAKDYVQWHSREFGEKKYVPTICFAVNNAMRNWDHCFLFDAQMLRLLLEEAGFVNVTKWGWGETNDSAFKEISKRGSLSWNAFETLALEAEKP